MKLAITNVKIRHDGQGLKIKTSLTYNDKLNMMTLTVEQVELDKVHVRIYRAEFHFYDTF